MEYIRILTCKAMTTDEIWVRILIYNDCGTEKFLNVFFSVILVDAGQSAKLRPIGRKYGMVWKVLSPGIHMWNTKALPFLVH